MTINQLLVTLLAVSPSVALSESILSSIIPDSWIPSIQKVAGALCDLAEDSSKPYLVSFAENSYYCDEESTGLLTNTAMAAVEEDLVAGRLKSRLAVKGQEHAEWGNWANDVGKALNTGKYVVETWF